MIIDLGYDYEKMTANLRGYYLGQKFYGAMVVMDWARTHHDGTRKDGRPEFSHQIMQASMLRSMPDLMYPELTHMVVHAHDLDEDHEVSVEDTCDEIRKGIEETYWAKNEYLKKLSRALHLMNKVATKGRGLPLWPGTKIPSEYYYGSDMSNDPIASIAKGLDRDHNLSTMIPTFSPNKIEDYLRETDEFVLPMLKRARKMFPQQASAYYLIAHQIRYKMFMAREWLKLKLVLNDYSQHSSRLADAG